MAGRGARAAGAVDRAGEAVLPRLALARVLGDAWRAAIAREIALRRPFLWLPVAAGAGALLYFGADREPSLAVASGAFAICAALAIALRDHRAARALFLALACLSGGFLSAAWRAARVDAPIVPRAGVGFLTGFVEELDPRRSGARFILRVASAEGLPGDARPRRVRLTTRGEPKFAAGDFIALKARVLPPAHAALPGGYDFARDAFFAGLGGVGNALGRVEIMPPPDPPPLSLRFFASVDRLRNDLARRVYDRLGGDAGAIAAAMVTGKRDFLSEEAKELIRRAGIFHIITISGVQMTLVAGLFFVGLRRLLALSRTLALNYPIKKWSAALAILGAIFYDIATGSRVGTERALVMTSVMLIAVIFDRPSLSMRNLAFAVFFVVAFEPEALLGASFQLSFAAVAALVAVYEARGEMAAPRREPPLSAARGAPPWRENLSGLLLRGPGAPLFATFCATSATASFMAGNFHELSPYVLIGNPLTLAIIEFFAVPAALLGAMLYPFGLDALVWSYLGFGIDLVTRIAGFIGAAPGASLPVRSFAPFALVFLSLAVLSAVLWRSWLLRASAIPFAAIGLYGAANGEGFDMAVAPSGEAAAVRRPSGELALLGRGKLSFIGEQWLRADADARAPADARGVSCDELGCVTTTIDGRFVALVFDRRALIEDCARAQIVIASFDAPAGCGAPIVLDRRKLAETGAVTLRFASERIDWRMARAPGEDRPWSRAPLRRPERETSASADEEERIE
ncbi:ComEC/Rec2 family competence protein [Methylosinus trichosporium]|uniref:Competence protein ComEC n=1 Tax=Methylosinus trichosporium (strain ATCC 35070 / NCIMB 11131 / UNIQEM 75 / OB3b) TaxID=595536 RepID=A0A2D2D5E9_METT3|nr:competence protein ComEC [Methylosinus trichosporium OB3b]OBS52606.1 competence protein ComEC [Methylosinus sp. 3S-1]